MSMRTLPMAFINLGGEMVYILDQRLKAQNIPQDKAKKVLHDIISTMFNKRFMDELFKPQELYSKKSLRTFFDKIAHASIMRLNTASMDKLYDLMTMAVKYQLQLSLRPFDILLVTLNHLDAIRAIVDDKLILQQVNHVYKLLQTTYGSLSAGEFHFVRQTLLTFFQDMHIRVSVFLKDRLQNTNGRFMIPTSGPVGYGTEVPGSVRVYSDDGDLIKTSSFEAGGTYTMSPHDGSIDVDGDRVIPLGTNIYSSSRPMETAFPSATTPGQGDSKENTNPLAKTELNLLAFLVGAVDEKQSANKNEFRLNFFQNDDEEEHALTQRPPELRTETMRIDISQRVRPGELSSLLAKLDVEGEQGAQPADLLDLMDTAGGDS